MNQIIKKAIQVISLYDGEIYHPDILENCQTSPNTLLTDEEFSVLKYFTVMGTGDLYKLACEKSSQELMDLFKYFDSLLHKLPIATQKKVFRMDTHEQHVEMIEYISRYKKIMSEGSYIRIPWSLSVSLDNWNEDGYECPIWEIELLEFNTKAHPVYPFFTSDNILSEQEKEVRFESNLILKIVSVTERDGFPYVQMKECSSQEISTHTPFIVY